MGFDTSDDASVFRVGDNLGLVQSIDFFPPMVDDPFLFGQIAAANSLSDIYAMGGRPSHAMNLLCIPSCLGVEVAGQILAGGADKCVEAGCSIAGGHTINDDEPKYGLSVSGFVALDRMLANSGARVGDALLLTKAVGSGIITTAIKGELIERDEAAAMFDSMRTLNEAPIRLAEGLELHGCTDITGFGLIGHACEMAEGSGVQIELASGAVPLFDQVLDMARLGIIPAGSYRNQDFFGPRVTVDDELEPGMLDALYDPQTSGGLLIAAPAADVDELARRLHAEGRIAAASVACASRCRAVLPFALFASPHVYVTVYRSLERSFERILLCLPRLKSMPWAMPARCPSSRRLRHSNSLTARVPW